MFSNYGNHSAFAPIADLAVFTPRDAASRFRTLEAEATFGAEVRRARRATRTLRREQKSRPGTSAGVPSTRTAIAG